MGRVLVTGGSGFLAGWCLAALDAAGWETVATVRAPDREAGLRARLAAAGVRDPRATGVRVADLTRDEGWAEAVAGCDFVLHVASPFGGSEPDSEAELIAAARDGTLRVLRVAAAGGVRRVVLTSSFAAVGYGHPDQDDPFTEADWTDIRQPDVAPYIRSKAVAERAAWDFMAGAGGMELSVINPVGIFGPVLGPDFASSIDIIRRMLEGAMPAAPRTYFGLVDVRDVADLHLRAMVHPAAAGERFLAVAGEPLSMLEVAAILREGLGPAGARAPAAELPDAVVHDFARTSPEMARLAAQLGRRRRASAAKARDVLGWRPRPNAGIVLDTARSLFAHGVVTAGDERGGAP